MTGKPQTLSNGQKKEVVHILRKKLLTWILIVLAVLTSLTGYGLWEIKERIQEKAEGLVAKQFEEPNIQKIVQDVAAEQATDLMSERIDPEVAKFKAEVDKQLKELYRLVATTEELEAKSQEHEQAIEKIIMPLQYILKQSRDTINQLSTVKSDIVKMQKHIATIQYYQLKGDKQIPNPYIKEMEDALNKLIIIAIPNTAERNKFITELQDPKEPREK